MTLYEAIFIRRTVRKYDMKPVEDGIIEGIKAIIENADSIEGEGARFEFAPGSEMKANSAPHYILAFCDDDDAAYANVGYVLQQADLYIQSIGLGSRWYGTTKPKKKKAAFCIVLEFGNTDAPRRNGAEDFKRLSAAEISNAVSDVDLRIAEAARLAPSGVNSQPWKLDFTDGKVTIRYFRREVVDALFPKYGKIDLGIVARHVELALRNEGRDIQHVTASGQGKNFAIEIETLMK
ncbi:MAG: hypothetical protein LBL49_03050 [Clostridiales Family XIII bacterium]|jgi:nitroreductase|nr:hypothetical protein [Clostridiales Family XIII bacterium]